MIIVSLLLILLSGRSMVGILRSNDRNTADHTVSQNGTATETAVTVAAAGKVGYGELGLILFGLGSVYRLVKFSYGIPV